MNRTWKLVALLSAYALLVPAHAEDQKKPLADAKPAGVADPLRQMMEKKGYVAIALKQAEEDGTFYVECKSGTETWRMTVDTGAETSSLDTGLAKKLGLKKIEEVKTVGIEGIRTGYLTSIRGITIGDFDTRTMANALPCVALDFTVLNADRGDRKVQRVDGLLGHPSLKHTSAVIDYSSQTLYMRTPLRGLWPEIEGRWVATGGQEDGRARKMDPDNPLRLEFKDRRFHLTDKVVDILYGMHVRPDKDFYTAVFFDPDDELAKELNYKAGTLLKVKDGKLTLCLCLSPAVAKGLWPSDFKAPAGSGHIVLEFRRDK